MKKILIKATLVLALTFSYSLLIAQAPPHPPGPPGTYSKGSEGHGSTNNNASGSGAPIGSGTVILLVMATAYAGRKTYSLRQQEEE